MSSLLSDKPHPLRAFTDATLVLDYELIAGLRLLPSLIAPPALP